MSVLGDMLVALPEDVQKIVDAYPKFPTSMHAEDMTNLTVTMLAGLLCVMTNRRFNRKLEKEFPVLHEKSFAITKISVDLVKALALVDRESIPGLVKLWREKQHLLCSRGLIGPWDDLNPARNELLERGVRKLQRLSKIAIREGKCLLFVQCP